MNNCQFDQFGFSPEILRAVAEMGYQEPTDIQIQSIPLILSGQDIIGHSQTGTGKTAAFGLPAVEMIDTTKSKAVQVLVLCPTRELAMQACDEMRKFAKYRHGVSVAAVYGGEAIERQILQLKKGVNIVIGTPGRIMDHMRRRTLRFQDLKMLVLDEADEMLNMGFREDIETILQEVPEERQTLLFSATMPPAIMSITNQYQKNPQLLATAKSDRALDTIEQIYYDVPRGEKMAALCRVLQSHKPKLTIIFCNTKSMVDELCAYLNSHGFMAEGLHGDMRQFSRTQVMERFKHHTTSILIATDVAARGIDVNNVDAVINYDMPQNSEYYIHRIGRTGRAGKTGLAITLISGNRQGYEFRDMQRAVKVTVQKKPMPSPESIEKAAMEQQLILIQKEIEREGDFSCRANVEYLVSLGYTAEDIAAAVLGMLTGRDKVSMAARKKKAAALAAQENSQARLGQWSTIKINVGRSSKIAPKFIMGAVTERTGLSGKEIGKIRISDYDTTVEIPAAQSDMVLKAMAGCKINGIKTVSALVANSSGYRDRRPKNSVYPGHSGKIAAGKHHIS